MPETPAAPLLMAATIASVAVVTDLRSRRIPNWLTGAGLLLGLLANVYSGGLWGGLPGALSGAMSSLAGVLLGLALLLPLYVIRVAGSGRAMGAGDVKLLAALGAIVGPHVVLSVAVYSAVAGALQALWVLVGHGYVVRWTQMLAVGVLPPLSGRKAPYAVAIAAGVFMSMLLPPIVRP
jgi:prepilin peptidase CpaA